MSLKLLIILILFFGGFLLAFDPEILKNAEQPLQNSTPSVTEPAPTPVPEVTPTGKEIAIKVNSRRGFIPMYLQNVSDDGIEIHLGDTVVWFNEGLETVTLVSTIPDFGTRVLGFDKRISYVVNKTGTYTFSFKENNDFNLTILVNP